MEKNKVIERLSENSHKRPVFALLKKFDSFFSISALTVLLNGMRDKNTKEKKYSNLIFHVRHENI